MNRVHTNAVSRNRRFAQRPRRSKTVICIKQKRREITELFKPTKLPLYFFGLVNAEISYMVVIDDAENF